MSSDQRLNKKIDQEQILDQLDQLSGSELNSFLLRLFDRRVARISPSQLMKQYAGNRFVKEADVDPVLYKTFELSCLENVRKFGFEPILLSPLTPLGTCSAIGEVDQKNVVSALRGTEVTSDITNVLAMKIARAHKSMIKSDEVLSYATTHRLVRAQDFGNPAFSAHFGLLGMVSGGFDPGSYAFEIDQLINHLGCHISLIKKHYEPDRLYTKVMLKEKAHPFNNFLRARFENVYHDAAVEIIEEEAPNNYYKLAQFKVFLKTDGEDLNLADGGLVDWTQKLTANKKHRCFISASGIELIYKFSRSKE